MVSSTDPNVVLLTGENSFLRLHGGQGGQEVSRASHWRVLFSPAGPGHVLFLRSEHTSGKPEVYADNIALARWLQREIEKTIYVPFSDEGLPVAEASFTKYGDTRSFWTEEVVSGDMEVLLTWYDFLEPFVIHVAPGSTPGRVHGVYSTFIPATGARLLVNGESGQGTPLPQQRDGRQSSSCCLALSETWVRPR